MTLAYTRFGTGQSVLLLHGIGLSRNSWDPMLPELAKHCDVLAVDLPGFGASPPLPDDVPSSPAVLAGAVAEPLRELDIDQPHVVGNSLGGWVALELAHIHPATSITLLSPAGFWRRARTPALLPVHVARDQMVRELRAPPARPRRRQPRRAIPGHAAKSCTAEPNDAAAGPRRHPCIR